MGAKSLAVIVGPNIEKSCVGALCVDGPAPSLLIENCAVPLLPLVDPSAFGGDTPADAEVKDDARIRVESDCPAGVDDSLALSPLPFMPVPGLDQGLLPSSTTVSIPQPYPSARVGSWLKATAKKMSSQIFKCRAPVGYRSPYCFNAILSVSVSEQAGLGKGYLPENLNLGSENADRNSVT